MRSAIVAYRTLSCSIVDAILDVLAKRKVVAFVTTCTFDDPQMA